MLQGEEVADAAINRVSNPSQSLITEGNDGIEALVYGYPLQHLGSIAGTVNLVDRSEVSHPLVGVKIGRKYAPFYALSPKEFAGTTRPSSIISTHLPLFLKEIISAFYK